MDSSKTEISITLSITIWGYPSRYSHYTLPDTAYHCWNISLRCISIINNVGTHLLLRRDVQDTASGRTRCYVGTQFREHQKRLSIAIFMAIYGRLWQFFYEKKHKSIIIKSQTKKRVHHELMVHPPKTTNNFTKLITYQSSSFCLPASLLHPM